MQNIGKLLINLLVLSFAGIVGMPSQAQADDCQDRFNSLTAEQRETYNIAVDEWKPAGANLPAHAFMVGCQGCTGANYDPTGLLINSLELKKIPTSWIMKVPKNCNGRGVVIIPPAVADQVQTFTLFAETVSALMNEGYTIAVMNHPSPGFPGFLFDSFIDPPFAVHDLRNGYTATGHLLRGLMSEVFGDTVAFYAISLSRGSLSGTGLLVAEPGSPFDGYVFGTGGNGYLAALMSLIQAYQIEPNRLPLTGIPPLQTTSAEKVVRLVDFLMLAGPDPDYIAFILSGATVDEQLARALAYNVAERPKDVQRAWSDLEFGSELKKPTIILQGLRDRSVALDGTIHYINGLVEAGDSALFRFYLAKDMGHGPADPPNIPRSLVTDAVRNLDAWVRNGVEPGSLNAGPFGIRPSCSTLGFGEDPLGCFCNVLGSGIGGFCSDDSQTSCMTNNPATPANEDICTSSGKGTCVAVIPEECGT